MTDSGDELPGESAPTPGPGDERAPDAADAAAPGQGTGPRDPTPVTGPRDERPGPADTAATGRDVDRPADPAAPGQETGPRDPAPVTGRRDERPAPADTAATGPDVDRPADPAAAAAALGAELLAAESADERAIEAEGISLARRLRQPRTIVSILVPVVVIVLYVYLNRNDLARVPNLILSANPILVLGALVIYYLGFPLRGWRWTRLLRGTGFRIGTKDASEIIFLSWLINCVVPAKLGDVYRAYLLKINSRASLSRTFGTVFIERILDLFAIAILGLAAGLWSFRNGLPPAIQVVAFLGVGVVVVLALGLLSLRNFGRAILTRLPVPSRVVELYERFEEGVFGAIGLRALPRLLVVTALIWATEALRLYLVVRALALPGVDLGLSGSVFVALIGSLLTAVPLSPAGLGIVEAGVLGVLITAYHVTKDSATAIVVLDRAISVFSIIVFGSIAYLLSAKPRGEGWIDGETAPALAGTSAARRGGAGPATRG